MRNLGGEYFRHDPDSQTLTGSDTGVVIRLGQPVTVALTEAVPDTGGLVVDLLRLDGRAVAKSGSRAGRGTPPRRKQGSAHKKSDKTARKVKRSRT
jgi:ribonuclease R